MKDSSKSLSIIAYYLSEYDSAALHALGFETQTAAFKEISVLFNRDNNYLKLRRDEFDALPDSSSARKGWRNRPPLKEVVNLAAYLKTFSFDELTKLVRAIIDAQAGMLAAVSENAKDISEAHTYSEAELETILNFEDPGATVKIKISPTKVRVYKASIVQELKKYYKGTCQICGCRSFPDRNCDLTEVHHIEYFALSHNNNSSNLIVVCPNHHRLIHKLTPKYDAERQCFIYPDGTEEEIKVNHHL